ncbi:ribokinase [Marinomonas ushuaiensis DSM 15871]|uniref:Ribokinase n=1 Tax=Marinomonas ushuaiensis DSM 15871 TaxID=1122207 RepID=X7E5V2_9GAMM|nr:ribokinase [Marinomonas ushuaiensis]ETX11332.1 ribokinase [Marinomonas ushuaiensis DSM 15871]
MTIYNVGSINLDHLYQLDHFVRPGETMASDSYQCLLGGKGANQSVALAKAGAQVKHVGAIHHNDQAIIKQLESLGVDTGLIKQLDVPTGHAIIQLTKEAENSIILYQGANHALTEAQVDDVLSQAVAGDWVLLQNETNLIEYTMRKAQEHNVKVAFNPAPMDVDLTKQVLSLVDLLIVNEVEAMDLIGAADIDSAIEDFPKAYPDLAVLMTLGKAGVCYFDGSKSNADNKISVNAFSVDAVDTTAAGDTFIGFCLSSIMKGEDITKSIIRACAASAICVTRLGAASSIPTEQEVDEFLAKNSLPNKN